MSNLPLDVHLGYAFYSLFLAVLVFSPIFAVINIINVLPKWLKKEVSNREILIASYYWCVKVIQCISSFYGIYAFLTGRTDVFIF